MLTGIFLVVLHYTFTYVGLSLTDSSKTAILKQLGTLLYICFCFLFIKEERFSIYKITGALVGFAGIAAINAGGGKPLQRYHALSACRQPEVSDAKGTERQSG